MVYEENILQSFTRFYEKETLEEDIATFKTLLEECLFNVQVELGVELNNNLKIDVIGSLVNNSNVGLSEPVDFLIQFSNPIVANSDQTYVKTRFKKQRNKIVGSQLIKEYLASFIKSELSSVSEVYISDKYIYVESLHELGKNYRIYLMLKDDKTDKLTAVNSITNLLFDFEPNSYNTIISEKVKSTDYNFIAITNIIKTIALNNNLNIESYTLECLMQNIPNDLYKGTLQEQLLKCFNYLKISNKLAYKGFAKDKSIFQDTFLNIDMFQINMFLNKLSNILKND